MANLPNRPYSPQPNGMQPTLDRLSLTNVASQLNSYATGMTQPLGNPYEDRAPPPDRYDDQHMRPTQPPPGHNGMMREGMSGYPAPSSPAPLYSAPEYNPSSQFPRAQIGRHY